MLLEVCVDTLYSCIEASEGGAGRLELCSSLSEGGLTPSVGFLRAARRCIAPTCKIFVMIRPRGGDFLYVSDEIQIMVEDIELLKEADGFVFGCLTEEGHLDESACAKLIRAAAGKPCTLHRAIDVSQDFTGVAKAALRLGFSRILTSGHEKTAFEGLARIKVLQQELGNKICIMPGSGVTPANAKQIVEETGVQEIHSSCSATTPSRMIYADPMCEGSLKQSNREIVHAIVRQFI